MFGRDRPSNEINYLYVLWRQMFESLRRLPRFNFPVTYISFVILIFPAVNDFWLTPGATCVICFISGDDE